MLRKLGTGTENNTEFPFDLPLVRGLNFKEARADLVTGGGSGVNGETDESPHTFVFGV